MLEATHDVGGEAGAVGAVRDSMVERQRERQQEPGDDVAVPHHRLLPRPRASA